MKNKRMGTLQKGVKGKIIKVQDTALAQRLKEMGMLEGANFEIKHEAPFGRDPMVVQIRGSLIALRRSEADSVEVASHE